MDKKKQLSPKQLIMLEALLAGKATRDALELAGYSRTSQALVHKVRLVYNEIMAAKAKAIADNSISKDECIATLKSILHKNSDDNTRIKALSLISKMMGYETQKVEMSGNQQMVLKFAEDKEELKNINGTTSL